MKQALYHGRVYGWMVHIKLRHQVCFLWIRRWRSGYAAIAAWVRGAVGHWPVRPLTRAKGVRATQAPEAMLLAFYKVYK